MSGSTSVSGIKKVANHFYSQICGIKRQEWPSVLGLSAFFFLNIMVFWILKPIKKGLLVSYYQDQPLEIFGLFLQGAESEQLGKILNMFVAFFLVMLFIWLYNKLSRIWLIGAISGGFGITFILYGLILNWAPDSPITIWTFYVFGDMYNTMMVTLFWAFTNDVFSSEQAKRAYGFVGLGGILGGLMGATIVTYLVQNFGRDTLLFASLIPMLLIILISFFVDKRERRYQGELKKSNKAKKEEVPLKKSSLMDGAKLVLSSKYLLAIAAMIGIYEIVSNIVDFQLSAAIAMGVNSGLETDSYFGMVGMITNISSVLVQMFLTVYVMKNFGVGKALLFLPIVIFIGSIGFLIIPGLIFATIMSAGDNSLNYSIQQSAKEALYTPTSRAVKYKAKAFIDMFIQRGAKAISVFLNIGLAVAIGIQNVQWLSLLVLGLIVLWIYIVRYMGWKFKEIESNADPDRVIK